VQYLTIASAVFIAQVLGVDNVGGEMPLEQLDCLAQAFFKLTSLFQPAEEPCQILSSIFGDPESVVQALKQFRPPPNILHVLLRPLITEEVPAF
jgi:hypothetical protein